MKKNPTSWFYVAGGKTNGPATQDDLQDLLDSDVIDKDTKVKQILNENEIIPLNSTEWKKISEIPSLFSSITSSSLPLEISQEPPEMSPMEKAIFENQKKMMKPSGDAAKREHIFDAKRRRYVTTDGLFEYDFIKKKWISIVMENDIEQQMSIYNYEDKKRKIAEVLGAEVDGDGVRKKRKLNDDEEKVSSIYVSNLPSDTNVEEIEKYFVKCGIIKYTENENPNTPLIYLYKNDDGSLKGDALITYLQPQSVDLAIKILDDTEIRSGVKVKVEIASFKKKNDVEGSGKKKKRKKKKKKKSFQMNKLKWTLNDDDLDWKLRSVIIKNMFKPDDFREDPLFKDELKKDITNECSALGEIERVRIFENNPEGVVHVIFKYQYSAQQCLDLMNGRYFDGRRLVCYFYDGKDYKIRESKEEEFKRLSELLSATTTKKDDDEEEIQKQSKKK